MARVHILRVLGGATPMAASDALDGDPRRVELADPTPDDGVPVEGAFVFIAGRPVIPRFMPTRMRWSDPESSIPDFEEGLVLNVSGRARGLIESLEPGVHQFLPVRFEDAAGRRLEQRYFLIPCNRIDSVDRDRTTMLLWQGEVWQPAHLLPRSELPAGVDPSVEPRLVFSLARIGRHHLWRDKHLRQGPFVSETMATALVESGMSGIEVEESPFEAF